MTKNSHTARFSAANSDRLLVPDDAEQFPPHLTTVLCLLALLGELSKSALLENMQSLGISPAPQRRMNPAEMADVLDVLQGKGWLQKRDHYWYLTPGHDNAVFLYLLTHRDIWQKMQQCTEPMRGVLRPERGHLWLAILAGDADRLSHHLAEWMSGYDYVSTSHPVARLFADDAGRQVFFLLAGDVQALLLATFLSDACYRLNDCTDIWRFTCDHIETLPTIPDVLRGPLALQALLRDERVLLDKLSSDSLPLSTTGWTALWRGDKEGAMAVYLQLATQYRKAMRKLQLPPLPPLPAMMVALTLLTREEPAHARALSDLTRYAVDEGFGIAWVLLKSLIRERDGTSSLPELPVSSGAPFVGMPGVLQALTLFWHDNTSADNRLRQRLTVFHDQLVSRGYRLPAYEIRTLLHLQFDEPAPPPLGSVFP